VAKSRAADKGRALRRKPLGLPRRPLPSIADEELSMRQNRALHPQIIRHYHAHVYYDPVSSRDRAARLRERVAATFPDATLGRWHDALVGPHPQSMYQIAFPTALLASFLPWLMLNRDGLTILLHPGTGNAYADHTDHAVWFGSMLPLRLDVLRAAQEAPASDA
jgi:aromatic ring-cleaving dioxygenase